MALTILFTILVNLVLIQGRTEVASDLVFRPDNNTHFDVYASALSKAHYNPWACDYRTEPGYNCLSCNRALHCYPGNFALLVQCAGLFPFCRNGYCSRFKTEGCVEDDPHNVGHSSTMPPYVQVFHKDNKTTTVPEAAPSHEATHIEPANEESAPSTASTQLNDPNKISEGADTSESPRINEKNNLF